jgi:DNA mismatch repair protein MutL
MVIKILPARLANQIAAGEVVERPASVVKELIENSLDSGASRIEVDIEKGGSKLIRVRDNGSGIEKDELTLALSRHATSKIQTLDDLEAIISLGFRGEALASISSVSRLTLTSRPATQEEAWQAHSEGRDMNVQLQPAAHPIGTTVEVLDLFFNTPARRKFLRTEKTEFTHIDEVLKRIALSRFDVTIHLRHNGKMIRQYRAAKTEIQQEKRIEAVCGQAFVRHMLRVDLKHQGLNLYGWITAPEGARQQGDMQFCYVNGRMMKDKLINHAIRQSYETSLKSDQYAAYVLYIELDPHQVDVNVHPAKHEVRFHQARLVHDFIYQGLTDALTAGKHIDKPELHQSAFHQEKETQSGDGKLSAQLLEAIHKMPSYPGRAETETPPSRADVHQPNTLRERSPSDAWTSTAPRSSRKVSSGGVAANTQHRPGSPSPQEAEIYRQLMQVEQSVSQVEMSEEETASPEMGVIAELGKAVAVIQGRYLLVNAGSVCCLVSLKQADFLRNRKQLDASETPLRGQPLLMPLSLKILPEHFKVIERSQAVFLQLGIELKLRANNTLTIMTVPQPLRNQNLQNLFSDLLSYVAGLDADETTDYLVRITNWLAESVGVERSDYTLSEAIQLIAEVEQLFQGQLPFGDRHFIQHIDFSTTIAALHS